MSERPLVLLVSGAPATGKSTLANELAQSLGLPLLAKDLIKESLFETLGSPSQQQSARLSIASYKILYAVLAKLVDAGVGVVVDCNFHRGRSEEELRPLLARSIALLIHCEASEAEIARRYDRRIELAERHPGHHDAAFRDNLSSVLESGVYAPVELDLPTLRVDTTTGYAPSLEAIRAFVDTYAPRGSRRPLAE